MKKIVSIVLAMVMTIVIILPAVYAEENSYFNDVSETAEYFEAVKWCKENGLLEGDRNNFMPDDEVTRAMAVTVLYRYNERYKEQPEIVENAEEFSDVDNNAWYYESVLWATSKEVIRGYDIGADNKRKFGPDNPINYGDMFMILYRFEGNPLYASSAEMETWAKNNPQLGYCSEDSKQDVTRAQLATILYNYYKWKGEPQPRTATVPEATEIPTETNEPIETTSPETQTQETGNDNYTTYSDAYKDNDGTIKSLRDELGVEKTYSVNQIGEKLFYIDNDFEISTTKITDIANNVKKVKDENGNNITAILIKVIEDTIYGIETENGGELIGTLFKATITENDGNIIINNKEKLADNANSFKIKDNYCYYIDTNDNEYSLKRKNLSDLTEVSVCYMSGVELKKVDYYNIIGNYMLYYTFDSDELRLAQLYNEDGKVLVYDIGEKYSDFNISNMHYINVDYDNHKFYGIIETADDKNYILEAEVDEENNPNFKIIEFEGSEGSKIRNISIFDGEIYARVNDTFTKIEKNNN